MTKFNIELSENTIEVLDAIKKKEKSNDTQDQRAQRLLKELRNKKGKDEDK